MADMITEKVDDHRSTSPSSLASTETQLAAFIDDDMSIPARFVPATSGDVSKVDGDEGDGNDILEAENVTTEYKPYLSALVEQVLGDTRNLSLLSEEELNAAFLIQSLPAETRFVARKSFFTSSFSLFLSLLPHIY